MDLQSFVDRINSMTCAISVERKKDGGHGVIRIVTGNKAYIDSIEDPNHMSSSEMLNNKFIPNCEYTRYIPQDNNTLNRPSDTPPPHSRRHGSG